MAFDIYPITIIMDRYSGAYSGGIFTAWNKYEEDIPSEISSDDMTCNNFWNTYKGIVGIGNSPNEAYKDLIKKFKNK